MSILHNQRNRFKFTTITENANSTPKSHKLNIPSGWTIQKRSLAGRPIKTVCMYMWVCEIWAKS